MINAKTVFELGSAIGYSTIWWARAVGEGGRVVYTDGDRKNAEEARRYFDRAGVNKQISIKTGDALELLSEEKQQYDIIFNDVDKEAYPRVFKLALPRLRKGGLLVLTMCCGRGRWLRKTHRIRGLPQSRNSIAFFTLRLNYLRQFSIRDGVAIAVKK